MRRTLIALALSALLALCGACQSNQAKHAAQTVTFETRAEAETTTPAFCGAMTKKNTPCRNKVKAAGYRCHLHAGR